MNKLEKIIVLQKAVKNGKKVEVRGNNVVVNNEALKGGLSLMIDAQNGINIVERFQREQHKNSNTNNCSKKANNRMVALTTEKATVTNFIEHVRGHQIKIYQLAGTIDKLERSRANANILFDEVYSLAHKHYSIVVINEELTGGIVYTFGATKENRYSNADYCKQAVNKHLDELGKTFVGSQSYSHVLSKNGALIKIPFKIISTGKSKPTSKLVVK